MITPQMFRETADALDARHDFMCCAFADRFDMRLRRAEFEPLLADHGVPLDGGLGDEIGDYPDRSAFHDMQAGVRFMFLEFLALEAEG